MATVGEFEADGTETSEAELVVNHLARPSGAMERYANRLYGLVARLRQVFSGVVTLFHQAKQLQSRWHYR